MYCLSGVDVPIARSMPPKTPTSLGRRPRVTVPPYSGTHHPMTQNWSRLESVRDSLSNRVYHYASAPPHSVYLRVLHYKEFKNVQCQLSRHYHLLYTLFAERGGALRGAVLETEAGVAAAVSPGWVSARARVPGVVCCPGALGNACRRARARANGSASGMQGRQPHANTSFQQQRALPASLAAHQRAHHAGRAQTTSNCPGTKPGGQAPHAAAHGPGAGGTSRDKGKDMGRDLPPVVAASPQRAPPRRARATRSHCMPLAPLVG